MEYPKLRPIEAFPVETSGQQAICIRDPLNYVDNPLLVPHNVFFIISLFDGNHSILDIQAKYTRQYGDMLFSDNVQKIIQELDKNLFLENNRSRDFIQKIKDDFRYSTVRKAVHAGTAYESDKERLREQIDKFFVSTDGPGIPSSSNNNDRLKGIIAPHIDIRSGGTCFAWAYKDVAESSDAELFIIFGIAHSGTSNLFALTNKVFETPFGAVETDEDFLESLRKKLKFDYFEDEFVHKSEHTIEFQLIFLQYLYHQKRNFKILPVLCSSPSALLNDEHSPLQIPQLENFVSSLKETIEAGKRKICIIASVDLAHVGHRFGDRELQDAAYLKRLEYEDINMLKYAEDLDAEGFYNSIQKENDRRRICGYPAIYTMLNVIKASEGRLLKYSQSTEPNTHSTVTFASMAFY
jgi:MEMO1 family protein